MMAAGVARADPASPDAQALLAELDATLRALTGDSGASSFDPDEVRGPQAAFLIARDAHGEPLGCGALRPLLPGVAELKRMYARPGSGAGAALLAALEAEARALGYRELRLSTRRANLRAVAFYRRHGYADAPPWGKYIGSALSVCLGRQLVSGCA
ncbi:GNAT family N-acetyltransferase [Massilia oculi]|uniref:GNAT family N-acetyltransferase n=1 Tax=Massilia hydrophila TaxID=3044279 RepID=A0ABS7YE25_9BURK|nr:GNAT family N-acetyltransferase [Massilia oculi]MCA1857307.1 GNAT family N-acetyltransferase [Massilia oculi]